MDMARLVVLNQEVGGFGQRQQQFGALALSDVESQRALVKVIKPEEEAAIRMRYVIQKWSNATGRVAAGWLEFDYVGAHIGQEPATELGAMITQIQDT